MAYIALSDFTAAPSRIAAGLEWLFAAPAAILSRWVKRKRLYMELMGMDDHRLADLGLCRGDIDAFVRRQTFAPAGTGTRRTA